MTTRRDPVLGKWSPYDDCPDCLGKGYIELFTSADDCETCKKRCVREGMSRVSAALENITKTFANMSKQMKRINYDNHK